MCGIGGALGDLDVHGLTARLLAWQAHRGPDGSGIAALPGRAVGMCLLRIRSAPGAAVPVRGGRFSGAAAYNGEVYAPGGSWTAFPAGGSGEVEAVLAGARSARAADGMYAVGWIPEEEPVLTLMRDPLGIKPLFWRRLPSGFAFASELQALARLEPRPGLRQEAIAEILMYGRPLGDLTCYEGIHRAPAGGQVRLSAQGVEIRPAAPEQATGHASEGDLREALRRSLERCLSSDRPVGLALSGGLDSAILAAELSRMGVEGLPTVSVCVEGTADGLSRLEDLGLSGAAWRTWRHHPVSFGPATLARLFDSAVASYGEPCRMTSLPLCAALADAARDQQIVVLLTGEGPDELFAGYESGGAWLAQGDRPRSLAELEAFACPPARAAWLERLLGGAALAGCRERFRERFGHLEGLAPAEALQRLELSLSLEPLLGRTDVCLMKESIEGRTPFLHGGVPRLAAIHAAQSRAAEVAGKAMLRRAWGPQLPALTSAPKRPFRAPVSSWFSGPLAGWLRDRLQGGARALLAMGFRADGLEDLARAATGGEAEAASLAYAVLTMASCEQAAGPNPPAGPAS